MNRNRKLEIKTPCVPIVCLCGLAVSLLGGTAVTAEPQVALPGFNRAPLHAKPYAALPLGAIKPEGWLKDQLERMSAGMTGKLDELYPEVCGDRNAWLGGDGDTWERGPYWIDGLYPLARLLDDKGLQAKAQKWIEWTLTHQRADGYIGPVELKKEERTRPAPRGAQVVTPADWWPRMVMLKILQQHYDATGDPRVIECLTKYFRYQQKELPKTPLGHWSFWGKWRGGDNLMVIYWLYNITGDKFLLELGDLVYKQTIPYTEDFLARKRILATGKGGYHCVNLAQGMRTPVIRYQADPDSKHLQAVDIAFEDIELHHGQPYGLFGADENMHGRELTRGSELCTAVEMMFTLEKMLEITGNLTFADRLELVTYNALPTQISDDFLTRQYFQQANQVMCTFGNRGFINDGGGRIVYGLLDGYPCCTCNMHQGWPKFTQHLWMASADKGLAALVYAPNRVTATVANGKSVTIREQTNYPFEESITFTIETKTAVEFPMHLRVPGWCHNPSLEINGKILSVKPVHNLVVLKRSWENGDTLVLRLPAEFRLKRWHQNTASIYRGPLLYAMPVEGEWSEKKGVREVRPTQPWNYALNESDLKDLDKNFRVLKTPAKAGYPWSENNAPIQIEANGVLLPEWTLQNGNMAGLPPQSPSSRPKDAASKILTLIPYGCTTLRVSGFPTVE